MHWQYQLIYASHSHRPLRQQNLLYQSMFSSSSIPLSPGSDMVRSTLSVLLKLDWSISRAAKVCNVVWLKWRRETAALSAERDSLVTVVTCMSAAGRVSPLLVYSESTWKQNSYMGFPVQLQHATNRVGEIWKLHTMIPTVPWSCEVKEDPVIQDRHNCHTKNTQLLHLAQENGVV
jgi:hypothetical protein